MTKPPFPPGRPPTLSAGMPKKTASTVATARNGLHTLVVRAPGNSIQSRPVPPAPPPLVTAGRPAQIQAKADLNRRALELLKKAEVGRLRSEASPAIIQMMETIGSRVGRRNMGSRIRSARRREQLGTNAGERRLIVRYIERVARGHWNGRTRPAWEERVWRELADGVRQPHTYTCTECDRSPIYRRRDAPAGSDRRHDATVDHIINWRTYIYDNAEPDDDGRITSRAAKIAYNDTDNLQILCRSCNSRKNGPRNIYD